MPSRIRPPVSSLAAALVLLLLPALSAQEALDVRLARIEARMGGLGAALTALQEGRERDGRRIAQLEEELAAARAESEEARRKLRRIGAEGALEAAVDRLTSTVAAGRAASPAAGALAWSGYFDVELRADRAGDQSVSFDQHRLVLKLHADVAPRIAFDTEVEIEHGGVGADFLEDGEITVEYAQLRFALCEAFNLKTGALLVPFGRFNLLHDSPLQELTDRPLVDRRIVPTTWTEAGIGTEGVFHPADFLSIDYDVLLVNGLTDAISAENGTRLARGAFAEDNNDDKMIVGRLGCQLDVPFLDALGVGASFARGRYDDRDRRALTMLGLDWSLKKGPFEFLGEATWLDLERGDAEKAAGIPGGMQGWYAELRWRFFPESWRGALPVFTENSSFALIARYGEADTDTDGTAVDFPARGDRYRDDRRRLTLGLSFRPVERTVLKLEYQWIFEPSGIPDVSNDRFVASFATFF